MSNIIVSQETILFAQIFQLLVQTLDMLVLVHLNFKFAFNFVQFVSELQPPLFYDNDYRNVIEMMVNLLILRNY
jgi:hypothetical protein